MVRRIRVRARAHIIDGAKSVSEQFHPATRSRAIFGPRASNLACLSGSMSAPGMFAASLSLSSSNWFYICKSTISTYYVFRKHGFQKRRYIKSMVSQSSCRVLGRKAEVGLVLDSLLHLGVVRRYRRTDNFQICWHNQAQSYRRDAWHHYGIRST